MGVRNLTAAVAALSLLAVGAQVTVSEAHASGPNDRLYWVASTSSPAVSDGLFGSTAGTVSTATNLGGQASLGRAIEATDDHLYFYDGTHIVRSALNGTGKTTVVAGVSAPGQIVVSDSTLYYSLWGSGVWSLPASATSGTPSNILNNGATFGWDGIAVSGTTLYAVNYYTGGLYAATINGSSAATVITTNSDPSVMNGSVTKLFADGTTLYAAGGNQSIKYTNDSSKPLSTWSSIDTSPVSGTVSSLSKVGETLYYTMGTQVASVKTDGTASTLLSVPGQFAEAYSIAALAPATYTVTYDGNGSTSGSVPVDNSSPYLGGSTVTVLAPGNLTKADHQFWRWRTGPSSGTLYQSDDTFVISANTTLYAQWIGGPLEFRTDPNGPAITTAAFPDTQVGQTATLTLYVRNVGATVSVGNTSGPGSPINKTGGTCTTGGGNILPYNGTSVTDCTYTFDWIASTNTSRTFSVNYTLSNSVTLTGTALSTARIPSFDTPVSTADGYTVNVTNWNGSWTWTPTSDAGSVSMGAGSGSTLPLTVSGLSPSAAAKLTMVASRSGYVDGTATVDGSALPPTPPGPPLPPSAPRDVSATAGESSAVVAWEVPSSSGSFPISSYRVVASPSGPTCLVAAPTLVCQISGLSPGVSYTFTVEALNGAGWSARSDPSNAVTPKPVVNPTIVITGYRGAGVKEGRVFADGVTTHLAGETVIARVRVAGEPEYRNGSSRTVSTNETFTWQRRTTKKTYVYFTAKGARSNRIIITSG